MVINMTFDVDLRVWAGQGLAHPFREYKLTELVLSQLPAVFCMNKILTW